MKKLLLPAVLSLLAGCASSDRMVRMSGGVFDEYSAPKSSRIRSMKYQKVSRELSSAKRANKVRVAGLDDTLINIWPFFFRSNEYWSAMWPLIDRDKYGFAFRPFYNHEGDEYSILFPLSAWNPASGSGWAALFAWNKSGFGLVPFSWQWSRKHTGGAYYTPLFIYSYNETPLAYIPTEIKRNKRVSIRQNWSRSEISLFALLFYYGVDRRVRAGDQQWLYDLSYLYRPQEARAVWNYRFDGKKPFPTSRLEFEKFRQKIFNTLPQHAEKSYGLIPFWYGSFDDNGDHKNRFMLLAGNEKRRNYSAFDIMWGLVASDKEQRFPYTENRWKKYESNFTSLLLLSHFNRTDRYKRTGIWLKFNRLYSLLNSRQSFAQLKPAALDILKSIDNDLQLPATVVDQATFRLYLNSLAEKHDFPAESEYTGRILPLLWYKSSDKSSCCTLPILATWWKSNSRGTSFNSIPLMTFISRSPAEDRSIILTPLVYYSKEKHRDRSNYRIYGRNQKYASEYDCAELRDRYAGCGLFYRGRFGFNVIKEGIPLQTANDLRYALRSLHLTYSRLEKEKENIASERSRTDRWQTATEIERLQKLIRYERLKIRQKDWEKSREKLRQKTDTAIKNASSIGFTVKRTAFERSADAGKALKEFMQKYTEIRFYEDIGSGIFFNKQKYYNGDYKWHFLHILAGGEKNGSRESEHILHLLYRFRKEGNRSEKIIFPFISSVREGDDSRISFLWRVFSLSRRQGKTGGYIMFIPFGDI